VSERDALKRLKPAWNPLRHHLRPIPKTVGQTARSPPASRFRRRTQVERIERRSRETLVMLTRRRAVSRHHPHARRQPVGVCAPQQESDGAGLARSAPVLFAAWTDWFADHPEYAEWAVAIGTALLALATFRLARQARAEAKEVSRQSGILTQHAASTAAQVEVSRAALVAQVRPVLIDVEVGSAGAEELIWYERGVGRRVRRDEIHVAATEEGNFVCSVPLRNAGLGLAFIKDNPRLKHPARDDELIGRLTSQIVPPGERTRAFFAPGIPLEMPAEPSLILRVPYTDASGEVTLWTEAIVQRKDDAWRVAQLSIKVDGEEEPLVTSAGAV
jgi:hypothetical protein